MYQIPNSKILVLGGELKKHTIAYIYLNETSSYAVTKVVRGIIQFVRPGSGMDIFFHFEIEAYMLDCKLHLPQALESMRQGKSCESAIFDLAFEQTLNLVRLDLTQHPRFIECQLALKIRGLPMIDRVDSPSQDFYDLLFKFRKR